MGAISMRHSWEPVEPHESRGWTMTVGVTAAVLGPADVIHGPEAPPCLGVKAWCPGFLPDWRLLNPLSTALSVWRAGDETSKGNITDSPGWKYSWVLVYLSEYFVINALYLLPLFPVVLIRNILVCRWEWKASSSGDFEGGILKNTQQAILLGKRTPVLGASFPWPAPLHLERSWWRQKTVLAAGMEMGVWEHSCASDASQWGILHTICTADGKMLSGSSAGFFSDVLSITGIDACFLWVKLISWRPLFPKYNTGNYSLNFETWYVITLFSAAVRNCYSTSAGIAILLLWKEFVTGNYKKRHLTSHLRQKAIALTIYICLREVTWGTVMLHLKSFAYCSWNHVGQRTKVLVSAG